MIERSEPYQDQIERLRKYISLLRDQDARRHNLNIVLRVVMGLTGLALLGFYSIQASAHQFSETSSILIYFVPKLMLVLAVFPSAAFLFSRTTWTNDVAIRSLENDIDLLNIDVTSLEARAEKLFRNHQFELEKYYTQTLKHSSYIFTTGIICIALGFLLVAITFSLIYTTTGLSEKIITAVVGSVGSLAINFIGAIYLKMYSETMKSLTEFHNRLVLTHHLHFANFLNAKIKDDNLREKTLSELAQKLVKT